MMSTSFLVAPLLMRDPPTGGADHLPTPARQATWQDYRTLFYTPSFVLNTLGMAHATLGDVPCLRGRHKLPSRLRLQMQGECEGHPHNTDHREDAHHN